MMAGMASRRARQIVVISVALLAWLRFDAGFVPPAVLPLSTAALPLLLGALPASAEVAEGGAGFQVIMMAPVISLFAIVGVAMVGGFVLGIFVPPGEGDYGNMETTLAEREARERGWRRDVLRGYDEETYAVAHIKRAWLKALCGWKQRQGRVPLCEAQATPKEGHAKASRQSSSYTRNAWCAPWSAWRAARCAARCSTVTWRPVRASMRRRRVAGHPRRSDEVRRVDE
ncbi:unnamed protein product [Durusdinium trenchii]|uniref:Uncharacterized protein n=1 Tax=Durusdinium trenchii TaxID=1381693 RepID=A0ABP0L7J5_9DINO